MRELRDRVATPRPGWLSLVLLMVMALALSWSVQGAAWLEQMDYLVPVALWAIAAGALLGWLRWSIVACLPLAAVVGTGVVIWTVGGEFHPALDQAGRAFALRAEALDWTITVIETGYPTQLSPYAIGLGALMWTTAFMAAFAVYRYHRVFDAILLLGIALLVNTSATLTNLFQHLVLFVSAALLLWLRAALAEREGGWQRRRVNEEGEVPAAIMRSGIVFAAASVGLAWVLTGVAVASPLTGAWRNLDGVWTNVRDSFEGVFGSLENPQSRVTGSSFGSSFTVFGEWTSNEAEALVLHAPRPLYVRAVTYDRYTGRGFERTEGTTREVPAGEWLYTESSERPTVSAAVRVERIAIELRQTIGRNLLTAGSPLTIFAPAILHEPGGYPVIGAIEARGGLREGEVYEVGTAISQATEAQLRAAGEVYPESVSALYLDDSRVTDAVAELAREVTRNADTPYDRAKALARFLRSDEFEYATTGPETPANGDLVHAFLFAEDGRRGYCQYYASAMVMMARSLGIPARVAAGFAPGEEIDDRQYLAREASSHAWAEIYFPGYGWEIFEATPSIDPQFVRLRGEDVDNPGPTGPGIDPGIMIDDWRQVGVNPIDALPSPDLVDGAISPDVEQPSPDPGAAVRDSRLNNAFIVAVIVLAAFVAFWLRIRHVEGKWRLLPAGDRAWRRVTAAADRAGIGPRPSETIYEYAGWLEEQLPAHGEPIRTVADGRVWESYSGRRLALPAAARLEAAWARLRLPLLGLAIRRGARRLFRREVD